MFVLLNPFFMSVYMMDAILKMPWGRFATALIRDATVSVLVFVVFAAFGDVVFTNVLQVRFASFRIFGGLLFLILGVRYFLLGPASLQELRGGPEATAGAVAMPFMIGSGTVSASIVAGGYLPVRWAALAIAICVAASALTILALKRAFDLIHQRHEPLVARYVDVTGRIMALVTGTLALEMILLGVESWLNQLS